jgi:cell wall-associated NlpC family hydrolase
MQESSLRNLPGGDRDSIGLFQQRPSTGWGAPAQLHDPTYAAERFYRALLAVPGWQALPLTDAAQAVQRSAHPEAYADDEAPATALAAQLNGGSAWPAGCSGLTADDAATALPSAFVPPAPADPTIARVVGWALLQIGTPYSYGGDCTAARSGRPEHQCDCSSLTLRAYAQAQITLPRTAADQSRVGVPVPLTAVQPGDLLFSAGADGTPTQPGHVTMALGNGLIIEAPRTGLSVRVVQLTPDRAADIVAVRRMFATHDAA